MRLKHLQVGLMVTMGLLLLLAFVPSKSELKLKIPPHFPAMKSTPGNELTNERIELGRRLFYDPILSRTNEISCASCHKQAFAFSDTTAISPGVEGRLGNRNAPTLANVGYNPFVLFDGFLETLEKQVLVPIEEHAEMDFNIVEVAKRLKLKKEYVALSKKAYNREPDAFVITRSISAFERTLISGNSRYDQHLNGKKTLNESEKRGMNLFFNRLYCSSCHSGFNFTDFSVKNNGLYTVYADSGRMRVTKLETDRDLFKIPTLRNCELTAPYMHDGSLKTLRDVIHHYASGGQPHQHKSTIIQPFTLTKSEEDDLIAFLYSLTDQQFIKNKRFRSPF